MLYGTPGAAACLPHSQADKQVPATGVFKKRPPTTRISPNSDHLFSTSTTEYCPQLTDLS